MFSASWYPKLAVVLMVMVGSGSSLGFAQGTSPLTVEFPSSLHFLTPAGDDVEVGPGTYQVEVAESWLKLVPDGKGPAASVLVEATAGTHNDKVIESAVRVEQEPGNSDIFHLAMLFQNGTGLEAVGTQSGIRPRAMSLAFVQQARVPGNVVTRPTAVLPGPVVGETLAPESPSLSSCRLSHEFIPGSITDSQGGWPAQPHVAVFQNELHVVAGRYNGPCGRGDFCGGYPIGDQFRHFRFNGERWVEIDHSRKTLIGVVDEGTSMALAVFDQNLWAVWNDDDKQLWYSRFFDQWAPKQKIPGQFSKSTPALAVKSGRLHMLHQGKTSDDLWYSHFTPGSGWSTNATIGQKSEGTPGFAWFNDGFLHVMYQRAGIPNGAFSEQRFTTLLHSFLARDGTNWLPPYTIAQAESQDTPILLNASTDIRGRGLMVHRGSSTKRLWSTLYGTQNPSHAGGPRWYDDQPLFNLTSDGPVGLAFYKGCVHMVHKDGKKLIHSTFSLKQAHPEALK